MAFHESVKELWLAATDARAAVSLRVAALAWLAEKTISIDASIVAIKTGTLSFRCTAFSIKQ